MEGRPFVRDLSYEINFQSDFGVPVAIAAPFYLGSGEGCVLEAPRTEVGLGARA
jgi:hypothetical protein